MGSATRSALEASVTALDGAKGVTLGTAEQLLEAARAIDSSTQLRNILADFAIPAAAKADLLSRVFPALDKSAVALLAVVVDERWSSPEDLVSGIEELGIRAAAETEKTKRIEGEIFAFEHAVTSDPQLELALGSKVAEAAGKVRVVDALLGGKASDATLVILRHLVQSPRGRRVGELFSDAADIVAASSDRVVATVTSAVELSDGQRKRLVAALEERYGKHPQLNVVIDPALIGGFRVQIADDVIDGSVASRLQDLRIRLAG